MAIIVRPLNHTRRKRAGCRRDTGRQCFGWRECQSWRICRRPCCAVHRERRRKRGWCPVIRQRKCVGVFSGARARQRRRQMPVPRSRLVSVVKGRVFEYAARSLNLPTMCIVLTAARVVVNLDIIANRIANLKQGLVRVVFIRCPHAVEPNARRQRRIGRCGRWRRRGSRSINGERRHQRTRRTVPCHGERVGMFARAGWQSPRLISRRDAIRRHVHIQIGNFVIAARSNNIKHDRNRLRRAGIIFQQRAITNRLAQLKECFGIVARVRRPNRINHHNRQRCVRWGVAWRVGRRIRRRIRWRVRFCRCRRVCRRARKGWGGNSVGARRRAACGPCARGRARARGRPRPCGRARTRRRARVGWRSLEKLRVGIPTLALCANAFPHELEPVQNLRRLRRSSACPSFFGSCRICRALRGSGCFRLGAARLFRARCFGRGQCRLGFLGLARVACLRCARAARLFREDSLSGAGGSLRAAGLARNDSLARPGRASQLAFFSHSAASHRRGDFILPHAIPHRVQCVIHAPERVSVVGGTNLRQPIRIIVLVRRLNPIRQIQRRQTRDGRKFSS